MKTCDETVIDWSNPASALLQDIYYKELGLSEAAAAAADDDDDIDDSETLAQDVWSVAEVNQYVVRLKEFALFHGKSSILDAAMSIEECVASMHVVRYNTQSNISHFYNK